MNIHKNPSISQSLFVIPTLVRRHSQVHPKFSPALQRAPKLITITPIILLYQSSEILVTPVAVVRDPSYSEGRPEYPPRVWYSPEIDASKFALHILSDTPGVFQRLKYILLMKLVSAMCRVFNRIHLLDSSETCQNWAGAYPETSDMAVDSQYASMRDFWLIPSDDMNNQLSSQ